MSPGPARRARRLALAVPDDFDLVAVVRAHGWCQLAPFAWDGEAAVLRGVLRTARRRPLGFAARQERPGRVAVELSEAVGPRVRGRAEAALRRILAVDVELAGFHAACRRHPHLRWIARKRLGRFLRSEDHFEDLAKTLLTTNCTWQQTIAMVQRLAAVAGRRGAAGPAFPDPGELLETPDAVIARDVRVGYRARALVELAAAAARGLVDEIEREAETTAYVRRVMALRGFGDYAVASMTLLRGSGEHQVVDSWALARARERHFDGRDTTPAEVLSLYEPFGEHRGLVAWFDLHRDHYRALRGAW